jgi:hypothetical protein
MGDALTQLVVTPAIFYLVIGFPWAMPAPTAKRAVEGGLLTAGLILTGYIAFNTSLGWRRFRGTAFLRTGAVSLLGGYSIWHVWRLGAITIITVLSVAAALHDRGPFSGQSPADTAGSATIPALARGAALFGGHFGRTEKER